MSTGWSLWFVAFLVGAVALIGFIGLSVVARQLVRHMERPTGQSAVRSLWEFLFSLRTHRVPSLALSMQRAASGKPAIPPTASGSHAEWLGQIGFDPATLEPQPLDIGAQVAMQVALGPRVARPLVLDFPVMVAAMGYGSGLSDDAKVALAQAATLSGTAVSSGEGPYFPEERAYAERWILQLSPGHWAHWPATVYLADMLEVQWGQGSEAGIGAVKPANEVPKRVRRAVGGHTVIHAALDRDPQKWVRDLRQERPDIPIGGKIPASHHVEQDLALLMEWGVDVINLDSSGGGGADSPGAITDYFGVPAALAMYRAHRWLTLHGLRSSVSLVASGGVLGAADIAKLLALGADAVAVASSSLLVLSPEPVSAAITGKPPTEWVFAHGPSDSAPRLNVDLASEHATRWLEATRQELVGIAQALGASSIQEIGPEHLVARTEAAARAFDLPLDVRPSPWRELTASVGQAIESYQLANTALQGIYLRVQEEL